jgi:hypothetical protein
MPEIILDVDKKKKAAFAAFVIEPGASGWKTP